MRKKKALLLTVAMISIIPISSCAKESSTEPITEAVTIESIHTESESLTREEETESFTSKTEPLIEDGDSGRYGEYGEEIYKVLVSLWKDWTILDETELRVNATAMLGLIAEEDYESIITEIISLDRGTNPYITKNSAQQATQPTKPVNNNTSNNNTNPIQPAPENNNTTPQSETPAPETPAPSNNDEDSVISIEEAERMLEEAGLGGRGEVSIVNPEDVSFGGDGSEFNWQ